MNFKWKEKKINENLDFSINGNRGGIIKKINVDRGQEIKLKSSNISKR